MWKAPMPCPPCKSYSRESVTPCDGSCGACLPGYKEEDTSFGVEKIRQCVLEPEILTTADSSTVDGDPPAGQDTDGLLIGTITTSVFVGLFAVALIILVITVCKKYFPRNENQSDGTSLESGSSSEEELKMVVTEQPDQKPETEEEKLLTAESEADTTNQQPVEETQHPTAQIILYPSDRRGLTPHSIPIIPNPLMVKIIKDGEHPNGNDEPFPVQEDGKLTVARQEQGQQQHQGQTRSRHCTEPAKCGKSQLSQEQNNSSKSSSLETLSSS